MRATDDRRKLKRKALKQRKQEEKDLKRLEIQKLKALKYKEIEAKIEKIKEASGNIDIDLGVSLILIFFFRKMYMHFVTSHVDLNLSELVWISSDVKVNSRRVDLLRIRFYLFILLSQMLVEQLCISVVLNSIPCSSH